MQSTNDSNISFLTLEYASQLLLIHDRIKIVHPLIIVILFIIGITGNVLVFFATLSTATNRMDKRPTNSILVLCLAAADAVYLISSAPYEVINYSVPGWPYAAVVCPIINFIKVWSMGVGIFTMCSLALVRFMCLMFPFKYQYSIGITSSRRPGLILAIGQWVAAAFLALPNLIFFKVVERKRGVRECVWSDRRSHLPYWVSLAVTTYIIPFLLVTVLYVIIGCQVYSMMKDSKRQYRDNAKHDKEQNESRKVAYMVIGLVFAFLLCWFPYHFYVLIQVSDLYLHPSNAVWKTILDIVRHTMSYAHACINPIIYTFAAPGFKDSVSAALRCFVCCKKTPHSLDPNVENNTKQMSVTEVDAKLLRPINNTQDVVEMHILK